ncbi:MULTISPECIES: hypothetical protein [Legionella]|uniref:hypothetical protein n=1 Tax=Legionella TaxID=445 RepID=UPI00105504F8|nr:MULTISPECIES: hypothetical protein [Legionella]MCE3045000.1 hypothetical protein [Legionella sp. 16cNR16C]
MTANNENVLHHVNKMQQAFKDQVDHLRKDIKLIDEPQCKAMFETSAEVLSGLIKAFEDYKEKKEEAWKH